jgi:SNF2 family DNA or RNA helicase
LSELLEHIDVSSKHRLLHQLIHDLRQSGHRALIFSQFVRQLELVRTWLDAEKISYRYLDGSTPRSARAQRISEFQAGEGDLFLISLRAGGVGLNLTGADYVIHLDPWWNPAVEDQATDRAHRIGQERPVTVYRLIAEGTVEERILDLHERKRALADQMLAGSEAPTKLDLDELIALI